jgi:predicted Fe-Mo cluster-binding NifX family protein
MEAQNMKIAAITEDGKSISQHFGRAPHYMVVTVENGKIVSRELRDKLGHAHFKDEHHGGHQEDGGRHGFGPESDNRHGRMAEAIGDCEALLCRGMGMGAYESMKARNIRPVVTDIEDIDGAVEAYVSGQIVDHVDRLH